MVCSDIKAALTAKVAGPCPDRLCYRLLTLLACLAFLFAMVNVILGAQEIITEVEVDNLDVILFPTAWFCLFPNQNQIMQIVDDEGGCTSDQALVRSVDLKSSTGTPTYRCIDFGNRETSALARELEARFFVLGGGTGYDCYTMNENEKISSVPNVYTMIKFKWTYDYRTLSSEPYLFAGIFDPKGKTFAEQAESGMTVFQVDIANTRSMVTFTAGRAVVDELIKQDITSIFTSTKTGANIKKLSSMTQVEAVDDILADDTVVLKYNPGKSSIKKRVITETTGVGEIEFLPLSYVTRVVTQRYKTWDEIWSAFGGAWATAVLLVTAFYVQKTVEDPKKKGREAEPMDQVYAFRLRGASSKRAAIKRLYGVANDAYGAGKANIEEGQAAVEGLRD